MPTARGPSPQPPCGSCGTIPPVRKSLARLAKKHGKGKALTVLAHQLARAVYDMLKRETAFDLDKFFNA
jgi:hypothetical protein